MVNTGIAKMSVWSLLALGAAGLVLAVAPEEGTVWTINAGETETVAADSAVTKLTGLQDNGTVTIAKDLTINAGGAAVYAVGNGAGANGTLTVAAGTTLTVVGNSTGTPPGNSAAFAIGMMGGTGTVTVEAGASLIVQNAVLDIARNEDAHRELTSSGTLNIYGTVTTRSLECGAWFPVINAADLATYNIDNFPVVATINLEEGGVFSADRFACNDQTLTMINFNGGTLRAAKSDASYAGPSVNGAMRWNIASGKNLIFDSQVNHCKFSASPKRSDFFTLSGEGGLVKRGTGYLQIALPPECNTFTGNIVVEEGYLSLGRPLAEGQTVYVKTGAVFYPSAASDLAKITYEDPSAAPAQGSLYLVEGPIFGGLDLVGMAPAYRTDALGSSESWSWASSISGTVTHAEASLEHPFELIGQYSGATVQFNNTGLEYLPLRLSGAGTFEFLGRRTVTDGRTDSIVLADSTVTYKQGTQLRVDGTNDLAQIDISGPGKLVIGDEVAIGHTRNTGKMTINGSTVTIANDFKVGFEGGTGTLIASNANITAKTFRLGGADNRLVTHGTAELVNTKLTLSGSVFLSPTCPTTGADLTTVFNTLTLGTGTELKLERFQRNDDPRNKVIFDGGKIIPIHSYFKEGQFFYSGQNGIFEVETTAGNYVDIAGLGTNTVTMSSNHLHVQGEGGLRVNGGTGTTSATINNLASYGTLMLGYKSYLTDFSLAYGGDTVVESGVLRPCLPDIFPQGSGRLTGGVNGIFDLYGFNQSFAGIAADAKLRIDNTHLPAELTLNAGDADTTLSTPVHGATIVRKAGAGEMTVNSWLNHGLTVHEGSAKTVNTEAPCYLHYRFKIEDRRTASMGMMQVSEFKLMDGNVDVTPLRAAIAFDTDKGGMANAYPANETPDLVVDGLMSTKWLDYRVAASTQANRDRVWIKLSYAKPQRVTHYAFAQANDENARDISAWRLQGSNDGTTWTDLDVHTGEPGPLERWYWRGPFTLCGGAFGPEGALAVENGASFTADGGTVPVHGVSGAVTLANGATLVSDGGVISGTISGEGSLVKNGTGSLALNGAHTYTGVTHLEGGTVDFGATTMASIPSFDGKYFRFIVRETRGRYYSSNKTYYAPTFQLSRFELLDADGAVQNKGITDCGVVGIQAQSLRPGTFSMGYFYKYSTAETPAKMFDGSVDTKFCSGDALDGMRDAQVAFTIHLADTAKPIAGFTMYTANDMPVERTPSSWILQGSRDGLNWITLDERTGFNAPTTAKTVVNGGTPLTFNGPSPAGAGYAGKFFRFTFKSVCASGNLVQLSEVSLFDRLGNRVNKGLTEGANNATSALAPGTFSIGSGYTYTAAEAPAKLFDDALNTKWCVGPVLNGSASTYKVLVMRLADNAEPVCRYNLYTANDSNQRTPNAWTLEGSEDGVNWVTLDEVSGMAQPPHYYSPVTTARGFASPTGTSLASLVQVDEGATFNQVDPDATFAGLRIDLVFGGGTVNGLDQDPRRLEIVNFPADTQICGYELPLTVHLREGGKTNFNKWPVVVNGREYRGICAFIAEDGHLALRSNSTIIYIR